MSSSFHNLWVLTQREYLDTVKTKFFWISVLLAPILIVVAVVVVALLSTTSEIKSYKILDSSGWAEEAVRERIVRTDISQFVEMVRQSANPQSEIPEELRVAITELQEEELLQFNSVASFLVVNEIQQLQGREFVSEQDQGNLNPKTQKLADDFVAWWTTDTDLSASILQNYPANDYKEDVSVDIATSDYQEMLEDGRLDGYFVIPENVADSNEGLRFVALRAGQSEGALQSFYERHLDAVVKKRRVEVLGLTSEDYQWLQTPVRFGAEKAVGSGEIRQVTTRDRITPYVPIVFVYVMWFIVFVGASTLINSTVEEKNSKVIEVLLSTLTAAELMYGKIIAAGASILTMLGVWVLIVVLALSLLIGITSLPISGDVFLEVVKPIYFVKFIAYTLLGFCLLAALMSGIGATASSLKAAQTMITPVSLVMVVPLIVMMFIANDTDSLLAQVLTFIPIYTPFTLMMRAAAPPHFLVELLAFGIAVATTYLINILSVKIYEKAILREGPTPTYRQMVALVRN